MGPHGAGVPDLTDNPVGTRGPQRLQRQPRPITGPVPQAPSHSLLGADILATHWSAQHLAPAPHRPRPLCPTHHLAPPALWPRPHRSGPPMQAPPPLTARSPPLAPAPPRRPRPIGHTHSGPAPQAPPHSLLCADVLALHRAAQHLAHAHAQPHVLEAQPQVLSRDGEPCAALPRARLRGQLWEEGTAGAMAGCRSPRTPPRATGLGASLP